MRIALTVAIVASAARLAFAEPVPATQSSPKTGSFVVTFAQRSPESDFARLQPRLNIPLTKMGDDYDISRQPFSVYVPADYDGSTPFGVIVGSVLDGFPKIYDQSKAALDRHHLIMMGIKKDHLSIGTTAGLFLDAVYNLKQSYSIDPTRVYLMGNSDWMQPIGWCTGDIFTGDVYFLYIGFYLPIQGTPALYDFKPPPDLLRQAKTRPQILVYLDDHEHDSWHKTLIAAMSRNGFQHVYLNPIARYLDPATHDDVFGDAWMEKSITMLDSAHPKKPKPTSAPSSADSNSTASAANLLGLAQLYISNNQPDKAREKLNELIQRYPNDPAAARAKELLNQLDGK